ncbi:Nucleotidylyl transferase [Rhizopogon salebrosus TDB-379]|nr:Nucleotidylyl transferase [Rhizopogon salebrosus TDB-379]
MSTMSGINHALLFAHLPHLDAPHHLGSPIASVIALTGESLIIVLLSQLFHLPQAAESCSNTSQQCPNRVDQWDDVQRLLTYVYVKATKAAQDLGKVLLDISVVLRDPSEELSSHLGHGIDMCFRIQGDPPVLHLPESIEALPTVFVVPDKVTEAHRQRSAHVTNGGDSSPSSYPVVALGGTFDHLHAGHKILLSMAAWIASRKVIVGTTDDELLKNKSNKHVLEPMTVRMEKTRSFLQLFRPDIEYEIVPLRDVCGPTGWDSDIQALVVSMETLPGAAAIDKKRAAESLPPLRAFVIDVISSESEKLDHEDMEMLKQTKLSSTFIREWIVKNQTRSV